MTHFMSQPLHQIKQHCSWQPVCCRTEVVNPGGSGGAGSDAEVEVTLAKAGMAASTDKVMGNVSHTDAGYRKGVAPGSFIDLLVKSADRTSGRTFTDSEIAAQVSL